MAKAIMLNPYVISSTRSHLLHLRQVLPSSFLHPRNGHFVSRSAIFTNITDANSLWFGSDIRSKLSFGDDGNKFSKIGLGLGGNRRFTAGATHVNDPDSIDPPLMQSMEKKIKENLDAESVSVKDAYGDGRHVCIDVVSSAFEGQSAVNRQRMVYKLIWEELQSTVHAVDQMTTKTPSEAAAEK